MLCQYKKLRVLCVCVWEGKREREKHGEAISGQDTLLHIPVKVSTYIYTLSMRHREKNIHTVHHTVHMHIQISLGWQETDSQNNKSVSGAALNPCTDTSVR